VDTPLGLTLFGQLFLTSRLHNSTSHLQNSSTGGNNQGGVSVTRTQGTWQPWLDFETSANFSCAFIHQHFLSKHSTSKGFIHLHFEKVWIFVVKYWTHFRTPHQQLFKIFLLLKFNTSRNPDIWLFYYQYCLWKRKRKIFKLHTTVRLL